MTRGQRRTLIRILVSAVLFAAALIIPSDGWLRLMIFLVPYAVIGYDVLFGAARNIVHGQVFDENLLMSIATIGALAIEEYPEAVAVMLFYQVGELFQSYAVGKSRRSISALMGIRPDYANIDTRDGIIKVSPEEVAVGDIITIKPGERVPLDGVVIEGSSELDTAALTGESLPKSVQVGDAIISGCININGLLRVRVEKEFGESTVSRILDLVENSAAKKAKHENFITRFARVYTPAVVVIAVILAVLPPIILGEEFVKWVPRALIFLVVSCPCALVISIPMSFFGGIGGASKCGILVKGGNYLEALNAAKTIVFDKTGTLTKGSFCVSEVRPEGISKEELLRYAALAESYSSHPISKAVRSAAVGASGDIAHVEEIAGKGVKAVIDNKNVLVGNRKLMEIYGIDRDDMGETGSVVYVAIDGIYAGSIAVADELKEGVKEALSALKEEGVKKTVMLTGDITSVAEAVAGELAIDEVYAELLPEGKVEKVEELLEISEGTLAFVGDGINDAPVLSRADIGIAMGALGSDAAIESADIVLMDDDPKKILVAKRIAKKTLAIVKENIVFALGVKAVVMVLGAIGVASMWEAVFADVGVAVIAILNASRALKVNTKKAA